MTAHQLVFALRSTAIALLVIVAGGIACLSWAAYSVLLSQSQDIESKLHELDRLKLAVARTSGIKTGEFEQIARTTGGHFLSGGTDALIQAALQDRLRSIIGPTGAFLSGLQDLPRRDQGGLQWYGVRLQLTAPNQTMVSVLHQLESGSPILFVENLTLTSQSTGSADTIALTLDAVALALPVTK